MLPARPRTTCAGASLGALTLLLATACGADDATDTHPQSSAHTAASDTPSLAPQSPGTSAHTTDPSTLPHDSTSGTTSATPTDPAPST
ncbi:MAG: hypothetical protein EA398_00955, partial [Deltaproteobacteria bacterium]